MIKFFRRIRQQLLSENKFSKYLFYAIGEIFLVVIGILIALYINNLNQKQKDRDYELTMLSQVHDELKKDYKNSKASLPYFQGLLHNIKEVVKIKSDENYPSDSLQFHMDQILDFGISTSFNTSAFDGIESGGLDKISNPEIRLALSDLYGNAIPSSRDWVNEIIRESLFKRSDLMFEIFQPNLVSTEQNTITSIIVVDDPSIIRNNPKVDEMLASLNWPIPIAIRLLENLLRKMEHLMVLIEEELNS